MENKSNDNNFLVNGRVWIDFKGGTFIGQGKIELLIKTKELGSLRKASIEMKMSYRQAWYSINKMNKTAIKPLIILKRGGKNGGSAILTDFGNKVIQHYLNLQKDFEEFLQIQNLHLKI